jgi:hypothetical protein
MASRRELTAATPRRKRSTMSSSAGPNERIAGRHHPHRRAARHLNALGPAVGDRYADMSPINR